MKNVALCCISCLMMNLITLNYFAALYLLDNSFGFWVSIKLKKREKKGHCYNYFKFHDALTVCNSQTLH